jgi:hypothetical protein
MKTKIGIDPTRQSIRSEHTEQVRFFELVDRHFTRHKELKNVFAVPNGSLRNIVVAKKLKAEGVRPGVPDIFVDVPRQGYHGMRIEMKRSDGGKGLSSDQSDWFKRLSDEGYLCYQANGCMDAWAALCVYLGINNLDVNPEYGRSIIQTMSDIQKAYDRVLSNYRRGRLDSETMVYNK